LRGRHERQSDEEKQVNDDDPLESAMRQLRQAMLVQQQQEQGSLLLLEESSPFRSDRSFSERLYAERQKRRILASPKTRNSIEQALGHLTAAQEQNKKQLVLRRDNDVALARHLKAAIAQMHSLLNKNGKDNNRLVVSRSSSIRPPDTEATLQVSETITGTAFERAVLRLAQALIADNDNDDKSSSSPAFLMHTAIVKQGIKAVVAKLHSALDENVNSFQEMQDLSQRMLLLRQCIDNNGVVIDDPAAAASAVTSAIARFLDYDEATTEMGRKDDTGLFDNLMTLVWSLPRDTVVGSIVWSFAGVGSFRDEKMTLLQSSVFDLEWVTDMIG
jgi:hypothetical protein